MLRRQELLVSWITRLNFTTEYVFNDLCRFVITLRVLLTCCEICGGTSQFEEHTVYILVPLTTDVHTIQLSFIIHFFIRQSILVNL